MYNYEKLDLYTDGGSRGNPGISACAYFVFQENNLIDFGGKYLGISTNNQSEYNGLIMGLDTISKLVPKLVQIYSDSELLVKQINGLYKVKDKNIVQLFQRVRNILESINFSVEFIHIPRSKNFFADKLVNLILDSNI